MHSSKMYFNIIFLSLKNFDGNFISTSHFLYSQIYCIGPIFYMISDFWKNTFRYVVFLRFRMYRFLTIPSRLKYTQVLLITMRTDGSEYRRLKCRSKLDSALCYTLCCEDTWRNSTIIPSTPTWHWMYIFGFVIRLIFSRRKSSQNKYLVKNPTSKKTLGMWGALFLYWTVSGQALLPLTC